MRKRRERGRKERKKEGRDKERNQETFMYAYMYMYVFFKHIYHLFLFACISKRVDVEEYTLILILFTSISMALKGIGRILLILMLYSIIIYILGMF